MKKIVSFALIVILFFSSFSVLNHEVNAESNENENNNYIINDEDLLIDNEEDYYDENLLLIDNEEDYYDEEIISSFIAEERKGGDGSSSFETSYMIAHGLINSPVYDFHEGSFDFPAMSIVYHYEEHGKEVKATSAANYLNKAIEYRRTAKKGAKVSKVDGKVPGVKRYKKNGKYIDLAPDNRIVSFGTTK